ncbi:MAG: histidine phosphatase family protein [Acidimicrobiia bacterium]|nr:histidine phosphatase family protein [Acidimicrobiia bacterium]
MSGEETTNGTAPENDRHSAPLYLAKYRENQKDAVDAGTSVDTDEPLYLQRFRSNGGAPANDTPLWQRSSLATQQALTEDNRNKEISPPPGTPRALRNDVFLIRHGETQGYSTDSGLTPQGVWQAHGFGQTLARRVKNGETVVFRHAATNRATETAEQIHRGLLDGLAQYEKEITIHEPEVANEFRNFQFVSPDGLKDVTAAFREYSAILEGFERTAARDRPKWVVEMDRFWRTQQGGGDPIQHWLTIPLLHFEPPSMTVRRFWAGINRLSDEFPGARLAIATHSGCIRAFAVSALGYDPGEPYNIEHVRVKLLDDDQHTVNGRDATVAYRNRVESIKVPDIDQLPTWQVDDHWTGFTKPETESS